MLVVGCRYSLSATVVLRMTKKKVFLRSVCVRACNHFSVYKRPYVGLMSVIMQCLELESCASNSLAQTR